MSLRKKTFFLLAGIFLMAAIPLTLFLGYSLYQTHLLSTQKTLEYESDHILRSLDRYFFERVGDIKTLAAYPEIKNTLTTRAEITSVLQRFVENYQTYDSIAILDETGTTIAHSNQLHIGKRFPNSFSIPKAFDSNHYRLWHELEGQATVIKIGLPLFTNQNKPFRYIVFEINIDRLHSTLSSFISPDIEIHLYNQHGEILYSNTPIQSKFLTDLYPHFNQLYDEIHKIKFQKAEIRHSADQDFMSLIRVSDGFRNFDKGAWILVAEQDYNISLQKWKSITFSTLGLLGVGLIAIGYLLLPISTKIAQPIITIANIADEIGKGNFKAVELLPQRSDELGILSCRLKQMVEHIQNSIELIQKEKTIAQHAMQEAQSANQAKDNFLAVMSHEMRTPLNATIGFAQFIEESNASESTQEHAKIIRESGLQLLQMVNDILDYSKAVHGKIEFEKISFSLVEVIENSIRLHSLAASLKKIEMTSIHPDFFPKGFIGDPYRLQQVFNNLISNAIKFTDKGSIKIQLQYDITSHPPLIKVTVQDTGVGIAPESIPDLFDPFTQADSSTTRKYGGTGLGLAICKKIIDHWNGEINVISAPNAGSSFIVKLSLPVDLEQT